LEISAIKNTLNELFNKAEEKYEEKYNKLLDYIKEQIGINYFGVKKEKKVENKPKEMVLMVQKHISVAILLEQVK
jgi:uncharacterized protein YutD